MTVEDYLKQITKTRSAIDEPETHILVEIGNSLPIPIPAHTVLENLQKHPRLPKPLAENIIGEHENTIKQ